MVNKMSEATRKKQDWTYVGLWMHIDILDCGNVPCWVSSNENVSGQSLGNPN